MPLIRPIVLIPPSLMTPVHTRAAPMPVRLSSPSAAQRLVLRASTTAVNARWSARQATPPPTFVAVTYPVSIPPTPGLVGSLVKIRSLLLVLPSLGS